MNKVNEFFPIFEVVKGKPKKSKGWVDGILISADDTSRLCYGVVFDPAHYEGQEDLAAGSTQFKDDGADPGRTHDGGVTLQKVLYSAPHPVVHFTRHLPLHGSLGIGADYRLHPAMDVTSEVSTSVTPAMFADAYQWNKAEQSVVAIVGPEMAMSLSGQHSFVCPTTVHHMS